MQLCFISIDPQVVVLGPSTMHHGFDPIRFDAANANGGTPTRSFNLADPGSTVFAHEDLLERVLELEPANLRWVLIQSEGVHESTIANQHMLTPSLIAWHDLRRTMDVCALLREQGADELVSAQLDQWCAFAHRTFLVARASPLVEGLLGVASTELDGAELTLEHNGFVPLDPAGSPRLTERYETFVESQGPWLREVREWMAKGIERDVAVPPTLVDVVERIDERAEAAGVRAIFLTVAGAHRGSPAIEALKEGSVSDVLRYDDVARNAELFHPANRFDRSHFNLAGARLFTDLVADDYRDVVRNSH